MTNPSLKKHVAVHSIVPANMPGHSRLCQDIGLVGEEASGSGIINGNLNAKAPESAFLCVSNICPSG